MTEETTHIGDDDAETPGTPQPAKSKTINLAVSISEAHTDCNDVTTHHIEPELITQASEY